MNDLMFNIYAMSRPSSRAEYFALLEEAIRMGEQLEEMIDVMSAQLEANASAKAA